MCLQSFANRFVVLAALVALGSGASIALAQEQLHSDLTLRNTYLKTSDALVELDVSANTPVFTPTVITCANGQSCVVRIELSVVANLVNNVPSGFDMSAHMIVRVDGLPRFSDDPEIVFPNHEVLLGFSFAGTSTFSWVTVVTPGQHTIDILARPQFGGTGAFLKARTLTINVYKP